MSVFTSEEGSNYGWDESVETVDVIWSETVREVPCPAHCAGGLVEVHGQETDCITCEGYGTVQVDP